MHKNEWTPKKGDRVVIRGIGQRANAFYRVENGRQYGVVEDYNPITTDVLVTPIGDGTPPGEFWFARCQVKRLVKKAAREFWVIFDDFMGEGTIRGAFSSLDEAARYGKVMAGSSMMRIIHVREIRERGGK